VVQAGNRERRDEFVVGTVALVERGVERSASKAAFGSVARSTGRAVVGAG
jgi:hypothetical protein